MKTENETATVAKKAGRPASKITWPTSKFTVDDAIARNGGNEGLCKLQMRNRIRDAIKAGELTQLKDTKKESAGVGRPKTLYARSTQVQAWANLRSSRQGGQVKQKEAAPEAVETPEPAVVAATA